MRTFFVQSKLVKPFQDMKNFILEEGLFSEIAEGLEGSDAATEIVSLLEHGK